MEEFSRFVALFGEEALKTLSKSKVAIIGLGGVGGYVVECLARSGVGGFMLVDDDVVKESNFNRQLIALHSTLGKYKAELWKERILDINPAAVVDARVKRFNITTEGEFDFSTYDYVVDAIDSTLCKSSLIKKAKDSGCRVITSCGTGCKTHPTYVVKDVFSTHNDRLAAILRRKLRKLGITDVKAVYSEEQAHSFIEDEEGKTVPATFVYSPAKAGIEIAKEVIFDLIGYKPPEESEEEE
ncbi:MAG: ThiF family adenylyltransferase [Clostridia bacterium]|nr:ThiF family adenylyltransferase [Clostridia bacterium]